VQAGAAGRYWGWHGINIKGFAAMFIGAGVCMLTINSPVYQSSISKALNGADLTWILGLPVAALCYYVLARDDVRATAAVPASHLAQAQALSETAVVHEGLIPHPGGMPAASNAVEATDV
jgi:cytosine/uracil/thiamine/allantoin permease